MIMVMIIIMIMIMIMIMMMMMIIIIQDAYGEAPPPTPLRLALAIWVMRSWRLLGLRSKREVLGGLSWNILENSWHNRLVLEYLDMLLDVL